MSRHIEVLPSGELSVLGRASIIERVSWALYDFSNTIFSMNIATLYFPVWIVAERGASATAWSPRRSSTRSPGRLFQGRFAPSGVEEAE